MRIEIGTAMAALMQKQGAVLIVRHLPTPEHIRKELTEDGDEQVDNYRYMEATIMEPGKILAKTWCFGIEGALECLGDSAEYVLAQGEAK